MTNTTKDGIVKFFCTYWQEGLEYSMARHFDHYDNLEDLERHLQLPINTLKSIPIYARVLAVDAIEQVRALESGSMFRPGLYYIVLTDLCAQTDFNAQFGDAEGDLRIQWFHTAVIQSIGEIRPSNYVTFSKTIGDASLVIFTSFKDIFLWSQHLSQTLESLSEEYPGSLEERGIDVDDSTRERMVAAFKMRARRLVHLGEVSYADQNDPLSLAVSQTFKIEKNFAEEELGCTQAVADAVAPKLIELGAELTVNKMIALPGQKQETMSYYVKRRRRDTDGPQKG